MKRLIAAPGTLLVTDSLGALLSAVLLGLVLVKFESFFGMPRQVLYPLSVIAGVFSAASLLSYLFFKKSWKTYLKIIALANLAYSSLSLSLVLYFREQLTHWGWTYFLAEVAIIITLAIAELRSAAALKTS